MDTLFWSRIGAFKIFRGTIDQNWTVPHSTLLCPVVGIVIENIKYFCWGLHFLGFRLSLSLSLSLCTFAILYIKYHKVNIGN